MPNSMHEGTKIHKLTKHGMKKKNAFT